MHQHALLAIRAPHEDRFLALEQRLETIMAKMKAAMAAVLVLEKEGMTMAFGVPGAAINPFYSAMRERDSICAHPGAPRRGRVAHGRRLYARQARQHRRVHRHVGPGRHRHDHRALFRVGRLHPDPLHHRPGAACPAVQGGFPGRRHRSHRQARDQMGGDRARAGAGAARVPAGVPPDALRPSRPGADRPAVRRADGRDRVRHRHLRAAAGLQAGRDPRPGREGARHAERGAKGR